MNEENKNTQAQQAEDAAQTERQEAPEQDAENLAADLEAAGDSEEEAVEEPAQKPQKEKKKLAVSSQKMKRRGMSTLFTAGFLVMIILLNVVVSMLSERFPSMNLDLTAQGVNTLSEDSLKVIDAIKMPTTVTILGAEADVRDNVLMANYGVQYSQVAILADKIKERNANIKVEYVDLDKNPTYASGIGETNLSVGSVVVSTEKRHRVLQVNDLFNQQTDYTTGQVSSYSMVGTALASAISQTNSEKLPVIAFATGHEEIYDTSALQNVLKGGNFEAVSFNILTEKVPENAQMIMIASPSTDYTADELKKLDAFLQNSSMAADRGLLITFYPSQEALPNLSNFLKEWGIEVPRSLVVEKDESKIVQTNPSFILTQTGVDSTVDFGTDTASYDNVVMPESSPINLLFTSRDGVTTKVLAASYDSAYLVDAASTEESVKNAKTQSYTTVALAQKSMSISGSSYHQNVIVAGSSPMFAEGMINASAYGNGKYVTDMVRYATGATDSNTGLAVVPVQTNQADINMSQAASVIWGFGVFTVLIPLGVLVAGLVVFLKRRHL